MEKHETNRKVARMTINPVFLLGWARILFERVFGREIVEIWYSLTIVSISTSSLSLIVASEND